MDVAGGIVFNSLERPFSVCGWILQSLLAYIGWFVVLAGIIHAVRPSDGAAGQVSAFAVGWLLSVGGASLLAQRWPESVKEGRWVWVLPACVWLLGAISTLRSSRPSDFWMFFYVEPGPMSGKSGLVRVMVTVPIWCCCWHSAAMAYWGRRRRRKAASGGFADVGRP